MCFVDDCKANDRCVTSDHVSLSLTLEIQFKKIKQKKLINNQMARTKVLHDMNDF